MKSESEDSENPKLVTQLEIVVFENEIEWNTRGKVYDNDIQAWHEYQWQAKCEFYLLEISISAIPAILSRFQNLDKLELRSYGANDPKNWNIMELIQSVKGNLTSLSIGGLIVSTDIFNNFPKLDRLQIHNSHVKRGEFQTRSNATDLSFQRCTILTDNIFDGFENLTSLSIHYGSELNIDENLFKKLVKLDNLFILHAQTKTVHENAFDSLTNLKDLTLAENELRSVTAGLFKNLRKLFRLTFFGNRLEVTWDEFEHLSALVILDVSDNNITTVDSDKILKSMPNLEDFVIYTNPVMQEENWQGVEKDLQRKMPKLVIHNRDPGL